MQRQFLESDWKVFRKLRVLALDRFCQRVLDEIRQCAAAPDKSNHERYLAVYRLLHERDEQVADMLNNPRRSSALIQLARIQAERLLTDEEFARFSDRLGRPRLVMSQMAIASNIMAPGGEPLPPVPEGEGVDIHYLPVGRHSLAVGEAVALDTAAAEADYERIVEWTIPDSRDEWATFSKTASV